MQNIQKRQCWLYILVFAISVFFAVEVTADISDRDAWSLVPQETVFVMTIENVDDLVERLKHSPVYQMYKDPVMQPFVVPAEQKIREKIDELMKDMWKEAGFESPPGSIPMPQGRVVLAIRLAMKKVMKPDYAAMSQKPDWQVSDTDNLPMIEAQVQLPQFVLLADMGEKVDKAKELARQISSCAAEKGEIIHRTEDIRGIEVHILEPKDSSSESEDTFVQPSLVTSLCYGFDEGTFLIGSDVKLVRDVLIRLQDDEAESLAQDTDVRHVAETLGKSQISAYFNIKGLLEFLLKNATDENERLEMEKAFSALGFSGAAGLGLAISIPQQGKEAVRAKMLLRTHGDPSGVVALLSPEATTNKHNRLLTKGLAWYLTANYDLSKLYDDICQLVVSVVGFDLSAFAQGNMAMTRQPGDGGQPPVDLRQEVFGQFSRPITVLQSIKKPYSSPGAVTTLLAIAVLDESILERALARIHNTFIAQGNPELRREMFGTVIYLLPESVNFGAIFNPAGVPPSESEGQENSQQLAFAVAGDHFVFGLVPAVEQAIRDVRRSDIENIQADPVYQYAGRYLPEKAGIVSYENEQITSEMAWTMLKNAATEQAKKTKQAMAGKINFSDEEFEHEVTVGLPMAGNTLMIEQLRDYCDFSSLPDFAAVKKYFGASIWYLTTREEGIFLEYISLRAPEVSNVQ